MATGRLVVSSAVTVVATIQLNEHELAALDALAGYGVDAFLKTFYEHMGKAYLQPHEAGLRSLFEAIRDEVPSVVGRAKRARYALTQLGSMPVPAAAPVGEGE